MKQIEIKKICDEHNLFFEKSNEVSGHPYSIFFNSKTGAKEILCINLAECLTAIDELIAIRKVEKKK